MSVSMFNARHYEEAVEFFKTAEDKVDWRVHLRKAVPTAAAFAAGTGAGMLGGAMADKIYSHFSKGQKIPGGYLAAAAPVAGALLAFMYRSAQHDEQEGLNSGGKNPQHHGSGSVPRG